MTALFSKISMSCILWMALFFQPTHAQAQQVEADPTPVDFATQIRPILSSACFACHGPDEGSRAADLRIDIAEGAFEDRGGYQAIVPGNIAKSDLFQRITSTDSDLVMPPADHAEALKPEQIELIRRWIEQGAEYRAHWSFVPLTRPEVPSFADDAAIRSPIDAFVLEKIVLHGLSPADEADREMLIRRVFLDLIGLPPTPEEIDAFLADDQPEAYERLVDQLLRSERFGEHWARLWLDLARYADTKGYEKDQPREMWRYRDWLIESLNADMPYERFTLEQLAGDLLSDANEQTILATAFHRNTMTNDEGGTDDEEFRVTAVKDRVDTTLQVWMGLTMGCAKCHAHKYDPITHDEYYQFYAFFNQTEDADRYDDEPKLATPTRTQLEQQQDLERRINSLRQQIETPSNEATQAFQTWVTELAKNSAWIVPEIISATTGSTAELTIREDRSLLATGEAAERETYTIRLKLDAGEYRSLRIDALTDPSMARTGPGRNPDDPNFVLSELIFRRVNETENQLLGLIEPIADFAQEGWPVANAIDGNPTTGWAISPKQGEPHAAVFRLAEPLVLSEPTTLELELSQQYGNRLVFGALRFSLGIGETSRHTADIPVLDALAALEPNSWSEADRKKLDQAFRRQWSVTAPLFADLERLNQELAEVNRSIPRTPIMRELPADRQRTTRVHVRGNFLEPGDEVTPAVPLAFGAWPADAPLDRRGVAAWITSKQNPLTYRVAVNRVWAQLFGRGIVETEEDFGSQGSVPSHQELLDWLAVTFRDDLQGSLKELCRTIVLSSTYRRSSLADPEMLRRDPANRWWARAPRLRLSAEAVRDHALVVAGLLSDRIGGPSVMPAQPDGLWQTTYSTLRWETSPGEDRYRRAIYTFLRRTSPYPSLLTFDSGSREVCLIRRIPTNTPLQALVVLNDPVYFEAAGALGREMINAAENSEDRVAFGFRRAVGRHATIDEVARLTQLVEETRADLQQRPDEAAQMAAAGGHDIGAETDPNQAIEAAVWTVVGNVLLNLDEALVRP